MNKVTKIFSITQSLFYESTFQNPQEIILQYKNVCKGNYSVQ